MFERRWDAIIEISNKVDGLIDNGQIDASEQCMSTDTYLDFMTDIRDAIKPVVEYFYMKTGATVTSWTVTPVAISRLPF
jgi:hypothetical protein